ncbi:hypothetical protein MSAN_02263700 [Mycena sanguinolenta]|uniref:Uncharacterized protein n=1 Tax=Mycena sanguinolenta TaxID=230812 RepID=A0A8H7CIB8_9AGAR|nr:hypothetical protein MSAN_02263700 [Mycena sanguinolenta]
MLFFFALLPLLSAAAQTGSSRRLRLPRQTLGSVCTTPCNALSTSLGAGSSGGLASICTADVANNYVACFNCEVSIGALTQEAGQSAVDSYVSGCAAQGNPVSSITITATSGSSVPTAGVSDASSGASDAPGGASDTSGPSVAPGGASVATGGATVATGGASVATGGAAAATGGAPVATGGASAGRPASTGVSGGSSAASTPSTQTANTGGAMQSSVSVFTLTTVLVFLAGGMVI